MKIERGKIHGFSRIGRVLVPKIRVNPWTVFKRPDLISASLRLFGLTGGVENGFGADRWQ
jgi:hypothetical protein